MLKAKLQEDLKQAMLSGDKPLVEILRSMKSAILYKEVAVGKKESGLSDDEIISVLKKEYTSRIEAADMYDSAQDNKRAEIERYQAGIIKVYLPEELSEEAITRLVDECIESLKLEVVSAKDIGRLMGAVKAKAGNSVDGAMVAKVIQARIVQA
jgi:uncharacterized protein